MVVKFLGGLEHLLLQGCILLRLRAKSILVLVLIDLLDNFGQTVCDLVDFFVLIFCIFDNIIDRLLLLILFLALRYDCSNFLFSFVLGIGGDGGQFGRQFRF